MIVVDRKERSVSALFYQTFHYGRTSYPFYTLKWMTNRTWRRIQGTQSALDTRALVKA
jgi:hypothetical protein